MGSLKFHRLKFVEICSIPSLNRHINVLRARAFRTLIHGHTVSNLHNYTSILLYTYPTLGYLTLDLTLGLTLDTTALYQIIPLVISTLL